MITLSLCTFCVQISRKSSAGKWVKRCVVLVSKFAKRGFSGAILRQFGGGRQTFARECATWLYVSTSNFVPIGSDLPELISKKWLRTKNSIRFRHIKVTSPHRLNVSILLGNITFSYVLAWVVRRRLLLSQFCQSVRSSVCLSVTEVLHAKTIQCIEICCIPHDRHRLRRF